MSKLAHQIVPALMLALGACQPAAAPASVSLDQPSTVTIAIVVDGAVTIDGEVVADEALTTRLNAIRQTGSRFILAPDPGASYARVKYVLDAAIAAGLGPKMGVIGAT